MYENSGVFLWSSNEHIYANFLKIPLTIIWKKWKRSKSNKTHAENTQIWWKKLKETSINGEAHWIPRLKTLPNKYVNSCKTISKFTIPIKISAIILDIGKLILKFVWQGKGTRMAKTILKKVIKLEESIFLISRFVICLW